MLLLAEICKLPGSSTISRPSKAECKTREKLCLAAKRQTYLSVAKEK
jgi:hypothetical protein